MSWHASKMVSISSSGSPGPAKVMSSESMLSTRILWLAKAYSTCSTISLASTLSPASRSRSSVWHAAPKPDCAGIWKFGPRCSIKLRPMDVDVTAMYIRSNMRFVPSCCCTALFFSQYVSMRRGSCSAIAGLWWTGRRLETHVVPVAHLRRWGNHKDATKRRRQKSTRSDARQRITERWKKKEKKS